MDDTDHLEIYLERAAIMEHDGGLPRHEAEQRAYWGWRQWVGQGVKVPGVVREIVERARRVNG